MSDTRGVYLVDGLSVGETSVAFTLKAISDTGHAGTYAVQYGVGGFNKTSGTFALNASNSYEYTLSTTSISGLSKGTNYTFQARLIVPSQGNAVVGTQISTQFKTKGVQATLTVKYHSGASTTTRTYSKSPATLPGSLFQIPQGFSFLGWSTGLSSRQTTTSYAFDETKTIDLYAVYTKVVSTPLFFSGVSPSSGVSNGSYAYYMYNNTATTQTTNTTSVTIPEPTTKTVTVKGRQWTFDGWRTDTQSASGSNITGNTISPKTHVNYYAVYKAHNITVYYNKNNSACTGSMSSAQISCTLYYNSGNSSDNTSTYTITPRACSFSGGNQYGFIGWSNTADGSSGLVEHVATAYETITFFAQWGQLKTYYARLILHGEGALANSGVGDRYTFSIASAKSGSGSAAVTFAYNGEQIFSRALTTHKLKGFAANESGIYTEEIDYPKSGTFTINATSTSADNPTEVTIYAVWLQIALDIIYHYGNQSISVRYNRSPASLLPGILDSWTKPNGFTFKGWASQPRTKETLSSSYAFSDGGTKHLYAVFQRSYSTTYVYGLNGVTRTTVAGQMYLLNINDSATSTEVGAQSPPSGIGSLTINRRNWHFAGWRIDNGCASPAFDTTYAYPGIGDTCYAIYRSQNITVRYDANGGSGSRKDRIVECSLYYNSGNNSSITSKVTLIPVAPAENEFTTTGGYVCIGWAETKNGSVVKTATTSNPTFTFYAVYGPPRPALWEWRSPIGGTLAVNIVGAQHRVFPLTAQEWNDFLENIEAVSVHKGVPVSLTECRATKGYLMRAEQINGAIDAIASLEPKVDPPDHVVQNVTKIRASTINKLKESINSVY